MLMKQSGGTQAVRPEDDCEAAVPGPPRCLRVQSVVEMCDLGQVTSHLRSLSSSLSNEENQRPDNLKNLLALKF